jgi:hypothetical protein
MELPPQDKQPTEITESHEITDEPQAVEITDVVPETVSADTLPSAQAVEASASPEEIAERKEAEKKAEKRSRRIGLVAMLAVGGMTYIGFKTGNLDMIPTITDQGEIGGISTSISAATLTSAAYKTYNAFKK